MGLLRYFAFLVSEGEEKRKEEERIRLEEVMKNQGLEEWQKELVRKGEYDPYSFEEEDLEEDDYYYDEDR